MLLIRGIWLIGCQFTWLAFGMVGFSSSGHDGLGGGLGPPVGRLEVAAVGNDVGMCQRRDAGQILVLHLVSGGTKLVDDAADVVGVPNQHGIRE
jgi:hypothetical protein